MAVHAIGLAIVMGKASSRASSARTGFRLVCNEQLLSPV
jgi:hypothetical protein